MPINVCRDIATATPEERIPNLKVEIIEYGEGPAGSIDADDLVRITWDGPIGGKTLEPIQLSAKAFVSSSQYAAVGSPQVRAEFLESFAVRITDGSRLPIAASLDQFVASLPVPELIDPIQDMSRPENPELARR